MRISLLAVACVVGTSSLALAEDLPSSWADPSLEDALVASRIIVRGHVQPPEKGETEPRLAIEKVVAGEGKPGVSVPLWGSRVAPQIAGVITPLEVGSEGIFILRQAGPPEAARLELHTPSFGRFAVISDIVGGAFFRSSFVTVAVKADDYETFLKNAWAATHGAKPDVAFIDSCRTTLAALEPTDAAAAGPAHIALEGLRYGAAAKDAKLAARFFASPLFQLRISAARVLEAAGGADAGDGLLRLALNDSDPFVASVAIEALARVRPTPATATKDLLARLKNLDARSTLLRTTAEDPRTNEQPSPLMAAFETLRALGATDEASRVAVELLKKDETDPFMTANLHLAKAKATGQIPAIIAAFRPKENPYTFFNDKLGELLEELTGEKRGPSKDAWQAWLEKQKK